MPQSTLWKDFQWWHKSTQHFRAWYEYFVKSPKFLSESFPLKFLKGSQVEAEHRMKTQKLEIPLPAHDCEEHTPWTSHALGTTHSSVIAKTRDSLKRSNLERRQQKNLHSTRDASESVCSSELLSNADCCNRRAHRKLNYLCCYTASKCYRKKSFRWSEESHVMVSSKHQTMPVIYIK